MSEIIIDHNPSQQKLDDLDVEGWPIWEKEISEFPWCYEAAENCFILEGEVTVTPDQGEPVTVGAGDFVIFPAGMGCRWNITKPIRKHYNFG